MKRTPAQDAVWRDYKRRASAEMVGSFAKPDAPECSWWIGLSREAFSVKAADEFLRMRSSSLGQQSELILGGPSVERRKTDPDQTAELEA